jgi:23S rRNA (guanosine2251-2'-O)-methyltransferase
MASRSSQPGKRPRRPGERTEKERRAPQGSGPPNVGGQSAGGHGSGPHAGGRFALAKHPATAGPGGRPSSPPVATASGVALIYGRNPVREALHGHRRVHTVWLTPGTAGGGLEQTILEWVAEGSGPGPEIRYASPAQLTSMAESPDHQGIVASVDPYSYVEPDAILRTFGLLVALDEVQDPHNLGAVIRTAEGAGAGIVIPRHRAAEVTAAVVKASAGATEHAAICQVRNLADFLAAAKAAGFWVYGAAAVAGTAYTAQDYRYPTCFVVGSEGQGLGRRVESLCDVMVSLPLQGKVDSLNVSVSAGILLYEAVRQRTMAGELPPRAAASQEAGAGSPAGGTPAEPDQASPSEEIAP